MKPEDGGNWGIMGGAFDPIHYGHLKLAEQSRISCQLDGVLFVVNFSPPHSKDNPEVSFEDRVAMTELAVEDYLIFFASDMEKDIPRSCYTLTVVKKLKELYPITNWHLILGGDNLSIFNSWHKPEELAEEVKILVGRRPGFEDKMQKSGWFDKITSFEMPLMDISSTMIRELLRERKSIENMVPESVRQFINDNELYL